MILLLHWHGTLISHRTYLPGLVDCLGLTQPSFCFTMPSDPKTRREESVFSPIRLVFLFRRSFPHFTLLTKGGGPPGKIFF